METCKGTPEKIENKFRVGGVEVSLLAINSGAAVGTLNGEKTNSENNFS
jgi:hypothetical protein